MGRHIRQLFIRWVSWKWIFDCVRFFRFLFFFINFFFFYCLFLYRFFFLSYLKFFFIFMYLFFPIFQFFLGRLMHLFLRTRILGKEVQILDLQMKYVTTFSSFLDYQVCDFVWKCDLSNRLTAFIGNDSYYFGHNYFIYFFLVVFVFFEILIIWF